MSAPGITTRDYEKKAVQAFTAATAPRAAEYGPFPALIDGVTYLSHGDSNDSFPSGWSAIGASLAPPPLVPVLLPYGSTDPSIIWQHPLTTVPTAADFGYSTRTFLGDPGGPTTDPIKGMQLNRAGVSAAVLYSGPNASLTGWAERMRAGGQVRFEVESAYIGAQSGDIGAFAGGYIPSAFEVLFSLRQNISGQSVRFDKTNSSGAFNGGAGGGSTLSTHNFGITAINTYDYLFTHGQVTSGGTSRYHHGLEQFTEVAIAWEGDVGSKFYLFIDGIPTGIGTITNSMGNMLENLIFGALTSAGGSQVTAGTVHFIRNFQASCKPPNFKSLPQCKKIAVLSDSILGGGPSQTATSPSVLSASSFRQQQFREQLFKYLARGGCWFEQYYQSSMGGHTATQGVNGTQDFYSTTDFGISGRQRVRTFAPNILITHASNDFGVGVTPAQYMASWTDHLDYYFGLGNYAGQAVNGGPGMVVMTTVNDRTAANNWDATERSNVQAANALMRAFVGAGGTYDQLRPGYGKRLVLADLYNATNGVTNFTGKLGVDGIHQDWLGSRKMGQEVGQAIVWAMQSGNF